MVRGLWLAGSLGLGLLALAQLVTIPVVDFFGGVLVVAWARAALGAGILLGGCLWLAARRPTVLRVLAAAAAALALVYYATAGVRLLGWARDSGVHVPASSVLDYAQMRDVPDQTLHYTDIDGNHLPIASYLPESPRNASVVVHIHGGAWNSGSYLATGHNRWLAEHGHLVYSIEYTLSDADHHQWDKVVGQLQCGIARAALDAAAHGADASRVQLTGESAGGHLALLTAYTLPATSPCGTPLPTVTAVAVTYPAADPGLLDDLDPVLRQVTLHRLEEFVGGTPSQYPDRYRLITPRNHVTAATPPTLVLVGSKDHLTPPRGARELAAELDRHGVANRLVIAPAADHGMDANTADIPARVTRALVQQWFDQHAR